MKQTQEPVFEPMPETPAEPASTVSESAGQPAASLAEAKKNILVGLLWCIGGLAFSFISYYLTEAGGRYVIATGAILWGVWQAIMGLYVWLKIKHGAGEYAAFWRMLATAVCTALLIGYLTVLSTQLVDEGGELPLLCAAEFLQHGQQIFLLFRQQHQPRPFPGGERSELRYGSTSRSLSVSVMQLYMVDITYFVESLTGTFRFACNLISASCKTK